jgi:hypothetical protein
MFPELLLSCYSPIFFFILPSDSCPTGLLLTAWSKIRDVRSTLKMEDAYYFQTSVNIYQTTWCHIPENSNVCGFMMSENKMQGKIFGLKKDKVTI